MVLYAHALPMSKYKDGPNPSAVSFYGTTESFPVASSKHTNNMVYSRVYNSYLQEIQTLTEELLGKIVKEVKHQSVQQTPLSWDLTRNTKA